MFSHQQISIVQFQALSRVTLTFLRAPITFPGQERNLRRAQINRLIHYSGKMIRFTSSITQPPFIFLSLLNSFSSNFSTLSIGTSCPIWRLIQNHVLARYSAKNCPGVSPRPDLAAPAPTARRSTGQDFNGPRSNHDARSSAPVPLASFALPRSCSDDQRRLPPGADLRLLGCQK
jgi:hypothetical protein